MINKIKRKAKLFSCMRAFDHEIILFQTPSLSMKGSLVSRTF